MSSALDKTFDSAQWLTPSKGSVPTDLEKLVQYRKTKGLNQFETRALDYCIELLEEFNEEAGGS